MRKAQLSLEPTGCLPNLYSSRHSRGSFCRMTPQRQEYYLAFPWPGREEILRMTTRPRTFRKDPFANDLISELLTFPGTETGTGTALPCAIVLKDRNFLSQKNRPNRNPESLKPFHTQTVTEPNCGNSENDNKPNAKLREWWSTPLVGLGTQTQNAAFFERKGPERKPWLGWPRGKPLNRRK